MKHKILIVEDNKDVRENISEILALSGYETYSAANGKTGVEEALRIQPDLIICDIMMPELDGYGVLRILSKNNAFDDVPFIFLTAKTELIDMRKGMTLGADDYITKPFDDVELLDTIEVRLKKKKPAKPVETSGPNIFNLPTAMQVNDALPESFTSIESRFVRRKDLLYSEGQLCRNVFHVRSGRAVSTKLDDYSKEVITRFYQAPMFIGLASALTGDKYNETIKAFEDLEVAPINKNEFIHYILKEKSTTYFFLFNIAGDLIKSDEKLLLQAFGTVRMKLLSVLIDLYHFYEQDGTAIIPIQREDLASMAGTAKESIIRALSELKDEGFVKINGSDIVIDEIEKLTEARF